DTVKLKKISAEEDDYILPIMQDVNDIFLLTFLFYEKISAKFMIHMVLEDIYPSRLRELFKAKEKAEDHEYLKEEYLKKVISSKKSMKNVEFYFGTLREFTKKEFSKSKAPDQYLSLTEKIFKNISIDKGLIMNLLIEKIRESFRGEGYYNLIVLKAQVILNFLLALELIKNTMEVNDLSEISIKNNLSEKIEKFFKENDGTFYNAQAKSSFLLGVLTKNLLNIQYNERGSNPFIKRLKNLTMNERDIKSLYPQIINKLEEYDSNYYQQLEEIISAYLTLSGTNWKISVDEINYYFVLGLTLYKLDIFKLQKEEK
ncbi:MAG: TM1802 family CRISPR-associated protein, partial [Candidatus Eremiobacterota bacterium]